MSDRAITMQVLDFLFSICKVATFAGIDISRDYTFISKTPSELKALCPENSVNFAYLKRQDNYRAMKVQGTLDFSLVGIIAKISDALAKSKIPVFVISTFDTDYVLVKQEKLAKSITALKSVGICVK